MLNRYSIPIIFYFATSPVWTQDASFNFKENDFVTIDSENLVKPLAEMTIECWVKPTAAFQDWATIVHWFKLGGPEAESGFTLMYYGGAWRFIVSVGTGDHDIFGPTPPGGLEVWPGVTLDPNVWTHIAGTYNVSTGKAKIYKNGEEEASFDTQGGNINWDFIDDEIMTIAKSSNNAGGAADGYFDGFIDEVRLWHYEMNGEELQSVMCNSPVWQDGFEWEMSDLIGYWNFNDGEDTSIDDLSAEVPADQSNGLLVNNGSGSWAEEVYGNNNVCQESGVCADSVITSFPFFHSSILDETMGDDWSFQTLGHGVDYAYEFTLLTPKNLFIDTCDPLTDFDTILALKDECGNDVSIEEADDGDNDYCPEAGVTPPNFASIIENVSLDAGTYYIVLDGYDGDVGNYAIAVGTLPEIIGSNIAPDDSYIEIYFSEGMYTQANGNGAVIPSDFAIELNQNGGGATDVQINYLTNTAGGTLSGGEDTIRIVIEVIGEATGQEDITIRTQTNASIFNSFGIGILSSASITQQLSDQLAPFLSLSDPVDGSTNIPTNSDINLVFSETIKNNNGSSIDDSNAGNSIVIKDADTDSTYDYSITTSNNSSFIIDPIENLPEYAYVQVILSNIKDENGNIFSSDTVQFQTADESPPLIHSSSIASSNQYVIIEFNEGVYSFNSGTGGIEIEDLNYTFNPDPGHCDSISIIELRNYTGALLAGGESRIFVYIRLYGSPSGLETISFSPMNGSSIYDQAGNPMNPLSATNNIPLNASAEIISYSLPDSNEYVDIIFSDEVYGNSLQSQEIQIDDLDVTLNPNGGSATSVIMTSLTAASGQALSGGEDTIRIHLSFNNLPSGLETIVLRPSGEEQIYNSAGVLVPESENTDVITLFDQLPPSGNTDAEDGAINVDQNDTLSMTFNDDLYNPETGALATRSWLEQFVTLRSGDSLGADIPFELEMIGSPPILFVIPDDNYESEGAIFFDFSAIVADQNGNTVEFNFQASFSIRDYIPPSVDNSILAYDNSYIDLQFDDNIFGNNDSTGTMNINDIIVRIISNGSQMDSCTVTSLTRTDSNFLIGGESNIRVNLEYNNTPSGDEFIILEPTDNITIFDESGNQFLEAIFTDTTNPIRLNDMLPPSVDSITVPIDSFVVLMEYTPIIFSFNEKLDSLELEITSQAIDSVNFDSTRYDSSIHIILKPPFASFDSIHVNFSYLEDEAGLSTVDIGYTYATPILGDYDLDASITYNDLWDLVENWEQKNTNYELGPVTGVIPHLITRPDSKFTIDDGMAFVQMWTWYQETFGEIVDDSSQVGRVLNVRQSGDDLFIIINDKISSGRVQFSYEPGMLPLNFYNRSSKQTEMYVNAHFPDKGYSILDFARTGILNHDTIEIELEIGSNIDIFYHFDSLNGSVFQKGMVSVNNNDLPKFFKIYPAYPNPFNPVITIPFDIPTNNLFEKVSINIFDIKGREVVSLMNDVISPGTHKIQWYANKFSSGMYFVRFNFGANIKTQKIILLK